MGEYTRALVKYEAKKAGEAGRKQASEHRQQLPLPHRDMSPVSLCEEIVCFADLFYSKSPGKITVQKTAAQVRCTGGPSPMFCMWPPNGRW